MDPADFSELEQNLNNIDFGITPNDGIAGKMVKKLVKGVLQKCLQDRSGAAFYKIAHTLIKIAPAEGHHDLLDLIENGAYCTNANTLRQVYNCMDSILANHPETAERVVSCLIKRSRQPENDDLCVRQVFKLSEKIALVQPNYNQDLKNVKKNALLNLCAENAEKGLKVIAALVKETFPSADDLSIVYDGFKAALGNSALRKEAYEPILKLLNECAKSGCNQGENEKKLNEICADMEMRCPHNRRELLLIKQSLLKSKTMADKKLPASESIGQNAAPQTIYSEIVAAHKLNAK